MEKQDDALKFLEFGDGRRIAYRKQAGPGPTLLFLPGYASDMDGTKAVAIARFAQSRRIGMVRFDYSGTGMSGGEFEDGTLDRWLEEAIAVCDDLADGPVVLVGSSMGGWIALHLALRRPDRIAALVGIAAAPDFTEWGFDEEDRRQLAANGRLERPSPYGGPPQVTTNGFWTSGQALLLLDGPIDVRCPVRLLHGDADDDVPLDVAMTLLGRLRSSDVQLTIVKGGGHRLSEPREIAAILHAIEPLVEPTA